MSGAPPRLLALESATTQASVALFEGEVLRGERLGEPGVPHSESLLPLIDSLLVECGLTLAELDAFAISIGPGTFTSLRVGLATLKGLAFDGAQPVVAVSTLCALAARAVRCCGEPPEQAAILATLDARRGELYAGAWRWQKGDLERLLEEGVYTPRELARRFPDGALGVGEGAALLACRAPVPEAPPGWARAGSLRPHAVDIGLLALERLAAGGGRPARELAPHYLRRAAAEVERAAHLDSLFDEERKERL